MNAKPLNDGGFYLKPCRYIWLRWCKVRSRIKPCLVYIAIFGWLRPSSEPSDEIETESSWAATLYEEAPWLQLQDGLIDGYMRI